MRITILYSFVILTGLLFWTCELDKCLEGTGDNITRNITTGDFSIMEIRGLFDIELVPDTICYVEAMGGENIIKMVETETDGDTLRLYNYNRCAWAKDYAKPKLKLHFIHINYVDIIETSRVYSIDTIRDNFTIIMKAELAIVDIVMDNSKFWMYNYKSSAGVYNFKGKTGSLYISGYYNAIYNASELKSNRAFIKNYSTVDFKVWAVEELHAEIHNIGNIYYKGNPQIFADSISSTGGIYPLN